MLWFNLLCNWFFQCMRCDPHSYIDLVLLGVTFSDMIEDIRCTWVVWVLWVVVTNFKPSDVCFPISTVLAVCYLTSISDIGIVFSFKFMFMVIPLWLTCLHFDNFNHTLLIVMCWDWTLYEWKLCLLVCFTFQLRSHPLVRLLALIRIAYGSFGRILVPSFIQFEQAYNFFAHNLYWVLFLCPTCSCFIGWYSSTYALWNVKRTMLLLDLKLLRKDGAHCSTLIFATCDSTMVREEKLVVFLHGSFKDYV